MRQPALVFLSLGLYGKPSGAQAVPVMWPYAFE